MTITIRIANLTICETVIVLINKKGFRLSQVRTLEHKNIKIYEMNVCKMRIVSVYSYISLSRKFLACFLYSSTILSISSTGMLLSRTAITRFSQSTSILPLFLSSYHPNAWSAMFCLCFRFWFLNHPLIF